MPNQSLLRFLVIAVTMLSAVAGCDGDGGSDTDTSADAGADADTDTDADSDTDTDSDSDTDTDGDSDADCSDGCLIGAVCYPDGVLNPTNVCEICTAAASTTGWSDNDGRTCDDAAFCTIDDICGGGACAGTAWDCSDGIDCTGVESCDETADECIPGTATCVQPEVCDAMADTCVTTCPGCLIDAVCYGQGQANPLEVCLFCDTSGSTTAWSDNDGVSCDDQDFCNGADTCSGGTCSVNAGDPCSDDEFFCNGDESCNQDAGMCVSSGDPCTGDDLCIEADDLCCVPGVVATDPECNTDGDGCSSSCETELDPDAGVDGGA
ncbi:MAG: hypothetical protein GY854_17450 [Deltaproteobacteria bacterium]|nr:hypothetical protein [Deltaproteobacteria bacterium]